MIHDQGSSDKE